MVEIVRGALRGSYFGDLRDLFENWTNPDLVQSNWATVVMAAVEAKLLELGKSKADIWDRSWSKEPFYRNNMRMFEECKKEHSLDLVPLLKSDLEKRMTARAEQLDGEPTWILRNPGRQWTASINPMVGCPEDWYGKFYRKFQIGNAEIETTLRLARRRTGNWFHRMPNDVFRIILRMALWADAGQHLFTVSY
jgi:hypothetical protein